MVIHVSKLHEHSLLSSFKLTFETDPRTLMFCGDIKRRGLVSIGKFDFKGISYKCIL